MRPTVWAFFVVNGYRLPASGNHDGGAADGAVGRGLHAELVSFANGHRKNVVGPEAFVYLEKAGPNHTRLSTGDDTGHLYAAPDQPDEMP